MIFEFTRGRMSCNGSFTLQETEHWAVPFTCSTDKSMMRCKLWCATSTVPDKIHKWQTIIGCLLMPWANTKMKMSIFKRKLYIWWKSPSQLMPGKFKVDFTTFSWVASAVCENYIWVEQSFVLSRFLFVKKFISHSMLDNSPLIERLIFESWFHHTA